MTPNIVNLTFNVGATLTTSTLDEISSSIHDHIFAASGPEKITHLYWNQSQNTITVELADD